MVQATREVTVAAEVRERDIKSSLTSALAQSATYEHQLNEAMMTLTNERQRTIEYRHISDAQIRELKEQVSNGITERNQITKDNERLTKLLDNEREVIYLPMSCSSLFIR
jgi:paraquat-inducible protein B